MNWAGTVLLVLTILSLMLFLVVGMRRVLNYLNSNTEENKKNDKDDDSSHWNIPPSTE